MQEQQRQGRTDGLFPVIYNHYQQKATFFYRNNSNSNQIDIVSYQHAWTNTNNNGARTYCTQRVTTITDTTPLQLNTRMSSCRVVLCVPIGTSIVAGKKERKNATVYTSTTKQQYRSFTYHLQVFTLRRDVHSSFGVAAASWKRQQRTRILFRRLFGGRDGSVVDDED